MESSHLLSKCILRSLPVPAQKQYLKKIEYAKFKWFGYDFKYVRKQTGEGAKKMGEQTQFSVGKVLEVGKKFSAVVPIIPDLLYLAKIPSLICDEAVTIGLLFLPSFRSWLQ